jgi:lipid-A-disaccharide synthase
MSEDLRPDLLVVAGEHSGDQHAADWVARLKENCPEFEVLAFGGPALGKVCTLLENTTVHAVVGIAEVLRNYHALMSLLARVADWIERRRPKCVCLVDFPGFNLRLAKILYRRRVSVKGGGNVSVYYYISPQIWAWRANRRFSMSRILDAIGVIFPFEMESFGGTDLPLTFVGHPLTRRALPFLYRADAPLLLLPGSRKAAVRRIAPRLFKIFELLSEGGRADRAVAVYPDESIRKILSEIVKNFPLCARKVQFVPFGEGTVEASAALMSSGTASLSVGLAGIPGIIVYRANVLTYLLGRLVVKVPFLGIANLLLRRPIYPEFIQNSASETEMVAVIGKMLEDPVATRENFRRVAEDLAAQLSSMPETPPEEWILSGIDTSHRPTDGRILSNGR